jgi:glutaredoxin-related protein
MIRVYGTDICVDCRNLKAVLKTRGISVDFVDIIENTANMKAFLALRDHDAAFEGVRNHEGGAIGIPCFVREDGAVTLDADEAFAWIGQPKISEEELPE